MKKTFTKQEMINKVTEFLQEGLCDDACFLIDEGINMCYENDSEILETEDSELIELMD